MHIRYGQEDPIAEDAAWYEPEGKSYVDILHCKSTAYLHGIRKHYANHYKEIVSKALLQTSRATLLHVKEDAVQ